PLRAHGKAAALDGEIDLRHGTRSTTEEPRDPGSGIDRYLVLRIQWEEMLHPDAATGSQRQALERGLIIQGNRRTIDGALGLHGQIAECQAAELHARIEVALNERR